MGESTARLQTMFNDASRRHTAGQLAEAEQLYRRILSSDARHAASLNGLGVIAFQVGRLEIAENLIGSAISLESNESYFHHCLGVVRESQGKPGAALACFQRAVDLQPRSAEAHYAIANILKSRGDFDQALEGYKRAIALRPDFAEAHANMALTLTDRGEAAAAIACFEQALALRPADPILLYNLGNTLKGQGKLNEAEACYQRAISSKPDFAEAYRNRGTALKKLDRLDEASTCFERVLSLKPHEPVSHYDLGLIRLHQRKFDEALAHFEGALVLKPDYPEALSDRGTALLELKRTTDALHSFDRALAVNPGSAETLNNRGNALLALNRPDEALLSYERALTVKSDHAEAMNNRGSALSALGCFDEAVASYDQAIAVKPDYAGALSNRAAALVQATRIDEALASYQRATAAQPDFAQAHWGESLCRLLAGDFRRGWEKYEWRWRVKPHLRRDFAAPLWLDDRDVSGKTVLLYAEQGFGDTLQFCRYVPLVTERGARVVLEVPVELKRLLASLDGVSELHARGASLPAMDYQCPLLSLPLAFRTTLETIPAKIPYLNIPPDLVAKWEARLRHTPRPRIGLVWSGRSEQLAELHRSIAPEKLAPLLGCKATLVSLQKEYRPEDKRWLADHPEILDFSADLEDFADTAALASLMDVVVTIDTSTAHLAGALGLRVWILLSYIGDWRWMLERCDSPWYPTVRLYRQSTVNDWSGVIARVLRDLENLGADIHSGTSLEDAFDLNR